MPPIACHVVKHASLQAWSRNKARNRVSISRHPSSTLARLVDLLMLATKERSGPLSPSSPADLQCDVTFPVVMFPKVVLPEEGLHLREIVEVNSHESIVGWEHKACPIEDQWMSHG